MADLYRGGDQHMQGRCTAGDGGVQREELQRPAPKLVHGSILLRVMIDVEGVASAEH